ncbi:MAG TPA: O-antigen ligase family protein [Cyclobacteriaceae bacterium]|nr:O-antigen ligase family protein [Cyclobacteriaceae bacterium]
MGEKNQTFQLPKGENNILRNPGAGLKGSRSVLIYSILLILSLGLAVGVSVVGLEFGVIFLLVVVGVPVIIYSVANAKFGVIALLCLSYCLGFSKFIKGVPLGVGLDIFLSALLIGLIFDKWRRSDFTVSGGPISYVVWMWIIYNCLEFFNPMASREAWVYVIRGIALLMTFYFITLNTMDNVGYVRKLINVWIVMTLLGALYGLFQEFRGMSEAEKAWIAADDFRYNLIFNWGRYRIFSFFTDPTVFGILMSYTGLFCIALIPGPFKMGYKIFLGICATVMLLSMVYAGTRTAYAMIPAGLIFYALLTLQKKTLIICGVLGAMGAGIIFSDIRSIGPFLTSNNLERIRSAFNPSEDPSFQVRERSQAFIKPFIQQHPFGAGLGSIGVWGKRFSPDSPLSKFAPDSGYVRVAVELGWLGLIIYCVFFITIIVVGVRNYYRMQDPLLKAYLAGILAAIFSIIIANYPQEALIQAPTILIFYIMMALVVRLKKLDTTSTN